MEPSNTLSTQENKPRRERAENILDVAAEMLLRFGYKRVTVDDVAARAGIGKGTIYLHWKTREALFIAVLAREYARAIDELLELIQQDAQAALPQRLTASFYLIVMKRPLLQAVYTADLETLGRLGQSSFSQAIDAQEKKLMGEYVRMLGENGLMPPGITPEECTYVFFAVMAGFYLFDPFQYGRFELTVERRVEILGITVGRIFGIEAPPSPEIVQTIAGRTSELFKKYAELYRAQLRPAYE